MALADAGGVVAAGCACWLTRGCCDCCCAHWSKHARRAGPSLSAVHCCHTLDVAAEPLAAAGVCAKLPSGRPAISRLAASGAGERRNFVVVMVEEEGRTRGWDGCADAHYCGD